MTVYQKIQAVAGKMAHTGISKSRENKQQGFKFRGIDETLNTLSPVLADVGLVIIPRMVAREMREGQTNAGKPLYTVVVEAEFDFVSAEDGSKHTARTFGEAMDTADKATNKAMSVAYKYAAFLTFCIPLEGMAEDADAVTHEPAVKVPEGYGAWLDQMRDCAVEGADALRAAWKQSREDFRTHLTTHDTAAYKELKEKAQVAT